MRALSCFSASSLEETPPHFNTSLHVSTKGMELICSVLQAPKPQEKAFKLKSFFFHFLLFLHFFFSSLTALFSLLTSQAVTLARRSSSSRPSKQVQAAVLFLFPFAWHLSTWSKKLLASLEHCSNSASLVSLTENVQAASMSEEHLSSVSRVAE